MYPRVTRDQVAKRIVERNQAQGGRRPPLLKEWYNLAGGEAGFLLLETDDPHQVTAFLQPYMDLVSWDVHAIYPLEYDQQIQQVQQVAGQTRHYRGNSPEGMQSTSS
jgi:hypothetical protein